MAGITSSQDARVDAIRRFNRFYTQRIGMLRQGLYDSPWSLAQVRVLYELAYASGSCVATDLARRLDLDAGYLSRILRGFVAKGYVRKIPASGDARRLQLTLTPAGRKAFAPIDRASHDEIAALLAPMSNAAQLQLVDAMHTVETLLGERPASTAACSTRHSPATGSARKAS